MPTPKKLGRARMEIRAGALGPPFFDAVAVMAKRAGLDVSAFVREAVLDKIEANGYEFTDGLLRKRKDKDHAHQRP